MTTNQTANYIASRGIAKHMSRDQALSIYKSLQDEGWSKDGIKLLSPKGDGAFHFLKIRDNKISVFFSEMEVAS